MTADEARARLLALGLDADAAEVLLDHFADCRAPRQARARLLADSLARDAGVRSRRAAREAGLRRRDRALGRQRRARLPDARGDLRRRDRATESPARGSSSRRGASRPARSATGCAASPTRGLRRAADRHLAATAAASLGRPAVDGHEPARDRDPVERRRAARRRRLDGRSHPRRRDRRARPARGARPVRRRARAQGVRARGRARALRLRARRAGPLAPCSSWRGRSTTPCPAFRALAGGRAAAGRRVASSASAPAGAAGSGRRRGSRRGRCRSAPARRSAVRARPPRVRWSSAASSSARAALGAGEVVEDVRVAGILGELRRRGSRSRASQSPGRPAAQRLGRALPRRDREGAPGPAADHEDLGRRLVGDRAAPRRRILDEDERAGRRGDVLAVDGERRAAARGRSRAPRARRRPGRARRARR